MTTPPTPAPDQAPGILTPEREAVLRQAIIDANAQRSYEINSLWLLEVAEEWMAECDQLRAQLAEALREADVARQESDNLFQLTETHFAQIQALRADAPHAQQVLSDLILAIGGLADILDVPVDKELDIRDFASKRLGDAADALVRENDRLREANAALVHTGKAMLTLTGENAPSPAESLPCEGIYDDDTDDYLPCPGLLEWGESGWITCTNPEHDLEDDMFDTSQFIGKGIKLRIESMAASDPLLAAGLAQLEATDA